MVRVREDGANGRSRFALRAYPVAAASNGNTRPVCEQAEEWDAEWFRDKIRLGHAIQTPEQLFDQLWQRLRLDLETP